MRTVRQLLESKGPEVFAIGPDAAVIDAIRLMAEKGIGALVVLEPGGRLAGMVSERDYARKIVLEGRSSKDTPVRDIMTAQVTTLAPAQQVEEVRRYGSHAATPALTRLASSPATQSSH